MRYKGQPSALSTMSTSKSMPQLDFREALSTPEEKSFSPPTATSVANAIPADKKTNFFVRGVGLSRSTWTNIVFVTVASVGGLVCAFYFFNGGELLRAAAAWPSEFLYPRPLSTDKIDVAQRPNPADQFVVSSTGSSEADAAKETSRIPSANGNIGPTELAQTAATTGTTTTSPGIPGPGAGPGPGPGTGPGASLFSTATSAVNDGLNTVSPDAATLFQSLNHTATQTVASNIPKKTVTTAASSTIRSSRRKISSARQKLSVRATATNASSVTQTRQQTTATQVQAPLIQNQTMFGGGMVGSAGGVGAGGVGAGGFSGVGAVGGVSGVSGVGGSLGGVGGVGGSVGGVTGVVGGVIGGHH